MGNILNNKTTMADISRMQNRDFEPAKPNIKQFPNSTLPPIYDQNIGFPNGRKERGCYSYSNITAYSAQSSLSSFCQFDTLSIYRYCDTLIIEYYAQGGLWSTRTFSNSSLVKSYFSVWSTRTDVNSYLLSTPTFFFGQLVLLK